MPTVDPVEAFTDVDVVLFVGALPRKCVFLPLIPSCSSFICIYSLDRDGMERKDLIAKNAQIFSEQGKVLEKVAKKDVKVYNMPLPSPSRNPNPNPHLSRP